MPAFVFVVGDHAKTYHLRRVCLERTASGGEQIRMVDARDRGLRACKACCK